MARGRFAAFLLLIAVFALAVSSAHAAWGVSSTPAVVTLTPTNFDDVVNQDFVVVEFYAPWCGHCKKLEPEWEKAAQILKKHVPPITLAKVDADAHKDLGAKIGLQGFPTLKIYRNGVHSEYNGPREADGIVEYVKKQAGPAAHEASSADSLANIIESGETLVLGCFPGGMATDAAQGFLAAAALMRDNFLFYYTTDCAMVPEAGAAAVATAAGGLSLHLFKAYDAPYASYSGAVTADGIKAWVETVASPLVAELSSDSKHKAFLQGIFTDPRPKLIAMADVKTPEGKAFMANVRASAEANKDKLLYVAGDREENPGAMQVLALTADHIPAVVIHDTTTDKKFTLAAPAAADAAQVAAFIADYFAGKLVATIKSEDIPVEETQGPVRVVVAKSFEAEVFGGKDVLIEFYAPWCGHCKSLAPIYEEVGKAFAADDNIVVAKMDATANDVPKDKGFDVKGFPTIYFVSGVDGTVTLYSGDRSEADLVSFVKKSASGAGAGGDAAPGKDEL